MAIFTSELKSFCSVWQKKVRIFGWTNRLLMLLLQMHTSLHVIDTLRALESKREIRRAQILTPMVVYQGNPMHYIRVLLCLWPKL